MPALNFNEYLEDFLDLQSGMMSESEKAAAYQNYLRMMKPATRPTKHEFAGLKANELRSKIERLVSNQTRFNDRNPSPEATAFIASANAILAGRTTKAQMLDLIDENSAVSRLLNNRNRG